MFPLEIRAKVEDEKDLSLMLNFMANQAQFYPGHDNWIYGKCQERIEQERYKPFFAIFEGQVIGIALYEFLNKKITEIKNFRIDQEYGRRDLGHFLLRQVEVVSNSSIIQLDISQKNNSGVQFFDKYGFKVTAREELYKKGQTELIMQKHIRIN